MKRSRADGVVKSCGVDIMSSLQDRMGGAFSFGKKKDAAKGSGDNSLANYNVGTDTVE